MVGRRPKAVCLCSGVIGLGTQQPQLKAKQSAINEKTVVFLNQYFFFSYMSANQGNKGRETPLQHEHNVRTNLTKDVDKFGGDYKAV